jgi:uncharacterized membrane protein YoaK (UPF0700 family)
VSAQPGGPAPPEGQRGGPVSAPPSGPAHAQPGDQPGGPANAQPGGPANAQPGGAAPPEGQPRRPAGAEPVPWALSAVAVLLTVGSAATDVACFTRLGSVFASVMTSNIVFLGLAAAQHSGRLAERAAIAVAAYVIGVAAASRLAGTGRRPGHQDAAYWSTWIAGALITEVVLLAVFTIGWQITGASPEGGAQLFLLAVAAMAMGLQSGVVVAMGLAGVSTTYLTGTLTSLVGSVASPGHGHGDNNGRRVAALCALAAGAGLSGLLLATAQAAVPAVPLVMLLGVLAVGFIWLRPAAPAPEAAGPQTGISPAASSSSPAGQRPRSGDQ